MNRPHDLGAFALGCATIIGAIGVSFLGALFALYAAVYVAASAWSAAS